MIPEKKAKPLPQPPCEAKSPPSSSKSPDRPGLARGVSSSSSVTSESTSKSEKLPKLFPKETIALAMTEKKKPLPRLPSELTESQSSREKCSDPSETKVENCKDPKQKTDLGPCLVSKDLGVETDSFGNEKHQRAKKELMKRIHLAMSSISTDQEESKRIDVRSISDSEFSPSAMDKQKDSRWDHCSRFFDDSSRTPSISSSLSFVSPLDSPRHSSPAKTEEFSCRISEFNLASPPSSGSSSTSSRLPLDSGVSSTTSEALASSLKFSQDTFHGSGAFGVAIAKLCSHIKTSKMIQTITAHSLLHLNKANGETERALSIGRCLLGEFKCTCVSPCTHPDSGCMAWFLTLALESGIAGAVVSGAASTEAEHQAVCLSLAHYLDLYENVECKYVSSMKFKRKHKYPERPLFSIALDMIMLTSNAFDEPSISVILEKIIGFRGYIFGDRAHPFTDKVFGQTIQEPQYLPLFMDLLSRLAVNRLQPYLECLVALIVTRKENIDILLKQREWWKWIIPLFLKEDSGGEKLLSFSPDRASACLKDVGFANEADLETEEDEEVESFQEDPKIRSESKPVEDETQVKACSAMRLKLQMTILGAVLVEFILEEQHASHVKQVLNSILERIMAVRIKCGGGHDFVRVLFYSLITRLLLANSEQGSSASISSPIWHNQFVLFEIIENFVFGHGVFKKKDRESALHLEYTDKGVVFPDMILMTVLEKYINERIKQVNRIAWTPSSTLSKSRFFAPDETLSVEDAEELLSGKYAANEQKLLKHLYKELDFWALIRTFFEEASLGIFTESDKFSGIAEQMAEKLYNRRFKRDISEQSSAKKVHAKVFAASVKSKKVGVLKESFLESLKPSSDPTDGYASFIITRNRSSSTFAAREIVAGVLKKAENKPRK